MYNQKLINYHKKVIFLTLIIVNLQHKLTLLTKLTSFNFINLLIALIVTELKIKVKYKDTTITFMTTNKHFSLKRVIFRAHLQF